MVDIAKTQRPTPNGSASACQPKLSGSLPRAADSPGNRSCGARRSGPRGAGWPTRTRATSQTGTPARMDTLASHPSRSFLRMDMASTTWQAMSGSGPATGIAGIIMRSSGVLAVARNPPGPDSAFDPSEPGLAKKVQRGGSFLCTHQYCSRYMVGTRGKGDVDTGTNHLGFRCVMTLQQWRTSQTTTRGQ